VEHRNIGSSPLQFEFAALTDKGLVRATNEDAFDTLHEEGIVVVADGMGGYNAGEVASAIAVKTILSCLRERIHGELSLNRCLDEAERAIEKANVAIAQSVRESPIELRGMGTTVVVGIFRGNSLGFAWVGDSRLYLLRSQRLIQLTTDHTLVQELVNQHLFPSIEAAMASGVGENVLTRALGAEGPLLVDVGSVDLVKGDILLFCSDGLNHMLDRRSMERVLNTPKASLDAKAKNLVKLACDAGGKDNITVVLVEMITTGR
jgi:protein phosphatase